MPGDPTVFPIDPENTSWLPSRNALDCRFRFKITFANPGAVLLVGVFAECADDVVDKEDEDNLVVDRDFGRSIHNLDLFIWKEYAPT